MPSGFIEFHAVGGTSPLRTWVAQRLHTHRSWSHSERAVVLAVVPAAASVGRPVAQCVFVIVLCTAGSEPLGRRRLPVVWRWTSRRRVGGRAARDARRIASSNASRTGRAKNVSTGSVLLHFRAEDRWLTSRLFHPRQTMQGTSWANQRLWSWGGVVQPTRRFVCMRACPSSCRRPRMH